MRGEAARVDALLPAPSARVPARRPARGWVQALASWAAGPSAVAGMTDEARRQAEDVKWVKRLRVLGDGKLHEVH